MFIPWKSLNIIRTNTSLCAKGYNRKRHHLVMEEAQEGTKTAFQTYVCPLTNLVLFKYLG